MEYLSDSSYGVLQVFLLIVKRFNGRTSDNVWPNEKYTGHSVRPEKFEEKLNVRPDNASGRPQIEDVRPNFW